MKLTREQAITGHRKMWNWIADEIERLNEITNIGYLKLEYMTDIINIEFDVSCDCFCCEYARQNRSVIYHLCHKCPIKWDSDVERFMCIDKEIEDDENGLFARCCDSKTCQEQAALARQIANLPQRTDV